MREAPWVSAVGCMSLHSSDLAVQHYSLDQVSNLSLPQHREAQAQLQFVHAARSAQRSLCGMLRLVINSVSPVKYLPQAHALL